MANKNNEMRSDRVSLALEATETALEAIREGDIVRRETCLDVREAQLMSYESLATLKEMVNELEKKAERETSANTTWMEKRTGQATGVVEKMMSSSLLAKDVETMEKRVAALQSSVIEMNKSYQAYEREIDMVDLRDQVDEMCARVDREEKEFLRGYSIDEQSIELAFRGAIETLYGLQSTNPKHLERAKKLAHEMSVFRDAAANRNLYSMIAPNTRKMSLNSVSPSSSSESEFSSGFPASTMTSSSFSSSYDFSSSSAPSSSLFSRY